MMYKSCAQQEMILQSIRWYLAYSLSYRDIEEIMMERDFEVDHSMIQRWVVHFSPELEKAFHKKRNGQGIDGDSTRSYIKVKANGRLRDKKAALRFLTKAIERNGKPGLINIDKSGANTAAIKGYNDDHDKRIKIRQCKYLNNIIEQDQRSIKRQCRPMLGFKSFHSAQITLAGIELINMLRKGKCRLRVGTVCRL